MKNSRKTEATNEYTKEMVWCPRIPPDSGVPGFSAPDPLLMVMERMKAAPAETVYVGDHVVDIRSARAAKVRAVAVEGGPCSIDEVRAEKPDAIIKTVKDLIDLF